MFFIFDGGIVVLFYVKSKLRSLNLIGIPKAVAEATAGYIDSLEKQVLYYARLKEQGRLIELPALPGDKYYTAEGEEKLFVSIEEIVHLLPEIEKTIFLTIPKKRAFNKSITSYVPRDELDSQTVDKLRQSDREYYQDHKEEANKKDQDKYHMLHPNARYYKKRSKTDES